MVNPTQSEEIVCWKSHVKNKVKTFILSILAVLPRQRTFFMKLERTGIQEP
jgi:hypothetical protein